MNVNISDIARVKGASLSIEIEEILEDFESIDRDFIFDKPVSFKGQIKNTGGILKLEGRLKAVYTAKCYRCLNEVTGQIDTEIDESFVSNQSGTKDDGVYSYEGYLLELGRVFKDNIILNVPMKQLCKEGCRGCAGSAEQTLMKRNAAQEDVPNPQMQVLENFFKD